VLACWLRWLVQELHTDWRDLPAFRFRLSLVLLANTGQAEQDCNIILRTSGTQNAARPLLVSVRLTDFLLFLILTARMTLVQLRLEDNSAGTEPDSVQLE
jgi:hypothetical protein